MNRLGAHLALRSGNRWPTRGRATSGCRSPWRGALPPSPFPHALMRYLTVVHGASRMSVLIGAQQVAPFSLNTPSPRTDTFFTRIPWPIGCWSQIACAPGPSDQAHLAAAKTSRSLKLAHSRSVQLRISRNADVLRLDKWESNCDCHRQPAPASTIGAVQTTSGHSRRIASPSSG